MRSLVYILEDARNALTILDLEKLKFELVESRGSRDMMELDFGRWFIDECIEAFKQLDVKSMVVRNIADILSEAKAANSIHQLMRLQHEIVLTRHKRPAIEVDFGSWFINFLIQSFNGDNVSIKSEGDKVLFMFDGIVFCALEEYNCEPAELTLQDQLKEAIARQDYEEAARLRDEIAKRGKK